MNAQSRVHEYTKLGEHLLISTLNYLDPIDTDRVLASRLMMVQLCVASEQPQSGGPKLTHAQCEHDVHKHTSGAVTPPPSPGAGRLSKQWPPPAALVYFRSAAIAIYLSGRAGSRRPAAISLSGCQWERF
jgi:hypothetical protein